MHFRDRIFLAAAALCILPGTLSPARGDEPKKKARNEVTATPQQARRAIERGLTFLEKDAAEWRKERGCATCHHGTMTVWALSEAKAQGYAVGAEMLANMVVWTKDQFVPRISKPRDSRPGWNLVSVPAIYLGVMSQNLPILSRAEIHQVAVHWRDIRKRTGHGCCRRQATARRRPGNRKKP